MASPEPNLHPRRNPPLAPAPFRSGLAGARITLGVTGSIAAYKAATVARLLVKEGAEVRTVLTRSAREFVGPATFAGITGRQALLDMFDPAQAGESHVTLAASSDLVLIAPATADLLARLAAGRADDLLAALCLCTQVPILIAPAMHTAMWSHPSTQRNVATLERDGRIERIGPVSGQVASGDVGEGRMEEPETIVARVRHRLWPKTLSGRHLVVTAGPTVEDLDPVRVITNRSSGKMGFALAERASLRGARVTLITGPLERPTPEGVTRVAVRSARGMRDAVWQALGPELAGADALLMAAAVADYRPAHNQATKLHRETTGLSIELMANPDILAEIGGARRGTRPALIGFALQTDADHEVLDAARRKLEAKAVDLIVANHARDALEQDDTRAALVSRNGAEPFTASSKPELAERILDWLVTRFAEQDK